MHERNKKAHQLWQELPQAERDDFQLLAKQDSGRPRDVSVDQFEESTKKKLIDQSIQRIQNEVS